MVTYVSIKYFTKYLNFICFKKVNIYCQARKPAAQGLARGQTKAESALLNGGEKSVIRDEAADQFAGIPQAAAVIT